MKKDKTKIILLVIFVLALALRVWAVVAQAESERIPRADAKQYDNIAVNIISGNGFSEATDGSGVPTARRTPGYPLFLAAIYAIFGHSYIAVKIAQAFLGAVFCIVVFAIVNIVYNEKRISLIASFITAVYKPFVSGLHYYGGPSYILSEYLYILMLGSAALAVCILIKKENILSSITAGICIGSAILTRPEAVLFPVILIFYLFYISQLSIKRLIKKYLALYLIIFLTLSPWVLRNYVAMNRLIPLSTLGGYAFWQGNNSMTNGSWAYPEDHDEIRDKTKRMSEYEANKIYFGCAITELKNNPKMIPRLLIRKLLVHWAPFEEGFKIFNPYYAVIFLLGSIGIIFFRKKYTMENILIIFLLTTSSAALIIYGDPRYRYPYEAFLIIFSALTIDKIFKSIKQSKASI